MKLTQYFKKFFESSQSSGIILILCVLVSLFIANSSLGTGFQNILDSHLGPYSVAEWINDGLMSVFFLLVGLEIKREMLEGELSNIKNASLPIFCSHRRNACSGSYLCIFLTTELNMQKDGEFQWQQILPFL